ncbi:glycosyltransferase family 50 protein [Neolentinus lepideus HHB14362 ss-1]|uniref:GPI mannosyltransferase 1 n=1 Tax=Neolentinus lepideus HHB14362 ss-1 TaxID=1314782 RepID=A0A165TAL6_9AGAM|nr:glycosyltransferase family 50 protein [Neolentinus lepideus HHB14362 ss-1]
MSLSRIADSFPTFRTILVVSSLLRLGLILYSEWHDKHSKVKYTDIDYRVFSDAARFLLRPSPGNIAQGPLGTQLGFGDPYTRSTYRYTPLLALLLAPNEWVHPSFGKYLFAGCDILAGVLLYRMLSDRILPRFAMHTSPKNRGDRPEAGSRAALAAFLTSLHLLNPLVFTISTRGSSESILSLFVLLTLYACLKESWDTAAVLLGVSTHWKIYPVIYAAACVGVIAGRGAYSGWIGRFVSAKTVRFGLLSAGTFFALGGAMYLVWGQPFLEHTYLYHLSRLDHRHNFSPYFYSIYLTYPSSFSSSAPSSVQKLLRSPLTSLGPQMTLSIGAGLLFGMLGGEEHLPFTWFVQTVVFVVFNRVCTSQYFLWYILFLPLLIPRLSWSMTRFTSSLCFATWFGLQGLWLAEAYKLEFLGENVYFGVWSRGIIYLLGSVGVLTVIVLRYAEARGES